MTDRAPGAEDPEEAARRARWNRFRRAVQEEAGLRLGDLAVEAGLINRAQLDECLVEQRKDLMGSAKARPLGQILLQKRYLTARDVADLLARQRRDDLPSVLAPAARPPEVDEAARNPERLLARYVLVEHLGRGGTSDVWKAWDMHLGRWVAVKILHLDSPSVLKRLSREAHILASLEHPSIARVYELGEAAGKRFLVMALVQGRPADRLRHAPRRALEIARDAARGVQHAHEHGIIHRDLKPQNLMVDEQGRVVVTDFGLARPMTSGVRLTLPGTVLGTVPYMSPEQARGDAAGPASDVYSLGATLYHLLAGRVPFEGKTDQQVLWKVAQEDPVPPRRHRPEVPADAERICLKAMEKEPFRRYRSPGHLADDLERCLRGEPILARPLGAVTRAFRTARRYRQRIAVGGLAALSVLLAIALWSQGGSGDGNPPPPPPPPDDGTAALDAELEAARAAIDGARNYLYSAGADLAAGRARLESAVREVERIVGMAPGYARGRLVLARGLHDLGDSAGAEAALQPLLAEPGPLTPHARALRARVHLERALEASYRTATRTPEEAKESRGRHLAEVETDLAALGPDPSKTLSRLEREIVEVLRLWFAGRRGEILGTMTDREARVERPEELWNLLGQLHLVNGEAAESVRWQDRALGLRPHYDKALFERSLAHAAFGRREEEQRDLDAALAVNPSHRYALLNRAALLLDRRLLREALPDADRAVKVHPGFAEAWALRGRIHRALGDLPSARRDLTEAIRLEEEYAYAWNNRSIVHFQMRWFEEAEQDADRALSILPDFPDALHSRALARIERDRLEDALSDADRVVDLEPRRATGYVLRGNVLFYLRRYRAAIEDWRKAAELDPSLGPAVEEGIRRAEDRIRSGS